MAGEAPSLAADRTDTCAAANDVARNCDAHCMTHALVPPQRLVRARRGYDELIAQFLSSSSIAARPDQALQRTNACVMQCASQIARHPSLAAERRYQFDRRRGSVRLSGHLTHELPSLIAAPDKRVASRSVDEYCERLARQ